MLTRSGESSFILHPSSLVRCLVVVCIALSSACAVAQAYPAKPIRLIIPFPPGAPNDMVAGWWGRSWRSNSASAGGNLGLGVAAKSPADGYTLVLSTPAIAISPSLYSRLDYDAVRARRCAVSSIPNVRASVTARSLKQSRARAQGAAVAGHQGGRLGVRLGPTLGMFAPARTPTDIVGRVSAEILKALDSADLRDRFAAMGVDPWPGRPGELESLVRSETLRYGEVIRGIGLRLD